MKSLFGIQSKEEEKKADEQLCVIFADCLFIKRHGNCPEFQIKRYSKYYCAGPRMEECVRLRHYKENHSQPSEHMAPTGIIIADQRSSA